MALIDTENCPDFNYFKHADYSEIVRWHFGETETHKAFLDVGAFSPDRIAIYHDIVANFNALPPLEASFALCWQQFDARRRPSPDYWESWEGSEWVDRTKELNAKGPRVIELYNRSSEFSTYSKERITRYTERFLERFYGILNEVKEEYRVKRETFTDRFAELVRRRKPHMGIDENVLDTDAMVYVHLAIGFALHLERTEGRGERFWGLIDDALRAIQMPKTISMQQGWRDDPDFVTGMLYSLWNIETLIWSYLFQKHIDSNEHARALECFVRAARLSLGYERRSSPTIDWVYGYSHTPFDEDVLWEYFYEDDSHNGVQVDLVGLIVPAQKVVDAFDNVWEENSSRTNWGDLSAQCAVISEFYFHRFGVDPDDDVHSRDVHKHLRIDSKVFDSDDSLYEAEFEASPFWKAAQTLVSQRLSPGELVESLRIAEDKKIEDRLRLYFFPEHWDMLPEKARAALVSADREYESGRGRRPVVLDHLREAARAAVVETLAKPYYDFMRGKASSVGLNSPSDLKRMDDLKRVVEGDVRCSDLSNLVDCLFHRDWAAAFAEFLDSRGFSSEEKRFVNRLPGKLTSLNGKANAANHENRRASKEFDKDVREAHSEFLGVGRDGILPRLMRMHAKASRAVAARR